MDTLLNLINSVHKLPSGISVVNTTPHEITFFEEGNEDNKEVVPPCGVSVSAQISETVVAEVGKVTFVTTRFKADAEMREILQKVKNLYPDVVVIGSIIAAQAFPGLVVAMVAAPGFERVAPSEKRMLQNKFTTFGE